MSPSSRTVATAGAPTPHGLQGSTVLAGVRCVVVGWASSGRAMKRAIPINHLCLKISWWPEAWMEERGVGGGAREHNKLGCVVNGEEHLSHHLAAAPLPLPSLTFTCMGPPQPPSQPRYIAPSHLPASHHLLPFPPSPYPFPSPHTFNPLSRSPP
eukprot:scaffold254430_cov31-Tisochrysis_lutea.AAC.1